MRLRAKTRPDGQGGHGETHAPGRARERADVEKPREHARPRDDRAAYEQRDPSDSIGAGSRDHMDSPALGRRREAIAQDSIAARRLVVSALVHRPSIP